MKNFILLITMMTCLISHTQAQLRMGIKAGGAISSIHTFQTSENYPEAKLNQLYNNKTGIQFGFFMQNKIANKWLLQPELLWLNRGAGIGKGYKLHYNYISLPILVGYQPFEQLSVLFGPNIALLGSANYKSNGYKTNIKSDLHSNVDVGINIGIDYQLKNCIGFGMRYNQGLVTSKKIGISGVEGNVDEHISYKNHGLQFYMSYTFLK